MDKKCSNSVRTKAKRLKRPKWYQSRRSQATKRQKKALAELWPQWGKSEQARTLKYGQKIDLDGWFEEKNGEKAVENSVNLGDDKDGNAAGLPKPTQVTEDAGKVCKDLRPVIHSRRWLDIGFGNGTSLLELAKKHPKDQFLGSEIYRSGLAQVCIQLAEDRRMTNVRLVGGCVKKFLKVFSPSRSFDRICAFFPDPWYGSFQGEKKVKSTHHDDDDDGPSDLRLISADGGILRLLPRTMRPNGLLYFTTDVHQYTLHVIRLLAEKRAGVDGWGWVLVKLSRSCGTGSISTSDAASTVTTGSRGANDGHASNKECSRDINQTAVLADNAIKCQGKEKPGDGERLEEKDIYAPSQSSSIQAVGEVTVDEQKASDEIMRTLLNEFHVRWSSMADAMNILGKEAAKKHKDCDGVVDENKVVVSVQSARPTWRPLTRFEEKARKEGRYIWDFTIAYRPSSCE